MHAYAPIKFRDGGSEGEAGSGLRKVRSGLPFPPDLQAVLSFSNCVDLASGIEKGVLRHVVR